jgi:hypothetical protein
VPPLEECQSEPPTLCAAGQLELPVQHAFLRSFDSCMVPSLESHTCSYDCLDACVLDDAMDRDEDDDGPPPLLDCMDTFVTNEEIDASAHMWSANLPRARRSLRGPPPLLSSTTTMPAHREQQVTVRAL